MGPILRLTSLSLHTEGSLESYLTSPAPPDGISGRGLFPLTRYGGGDHPQEASYANGGGAQG